MIQGVIFDMDGVLVDSEEFINQAAIRFFEEKGYEVQPEDFIPFVGAGENRYIGGVAEKYGVLLNMDSAKTRTYEIYHEIVHGRLEPLPGVTSFIEYCKRFNLLMAVATSADYPKMEINITEMGIPRETFDYIITGSEIENKKPDPEIFIKAASNMGLSPEACLVVEDAVNGVAAAKKAGCRCLALTTSFTKMELAQADWISNTLADAPLDVLKW